MRKSESESDERTRPRLSFHGGWSDRIVSTIFFMVLLAVPNPWPASSPLRVHPANYHKGNHKLQDPPTSPGTLYLRGCLVLNQGEERQVRCRRDSCALGEARDLLRIHPRGVKNSILYDPQSPAPLDQALQLEIRTTCCSSHQEGRGFRVRLWIEDEHGVVLYPVGELDLGEVITNRGKARRQEPAEQRRRSKRQRSTNESDAQADRPPHAREGLAQHQTEGLASDQHPSNPEPGPIELTGSTTTSPAGTPQYGSFDWNPPICSISYVDNNSIDDDNSHAAPLRDDRFITPYPHPSVVRPDPLALPTSAPPQGEAAREDETEFDTNQFFN